MGKKEYMILLHPGSRICNREKCWINSGDKDKRDFQLCELEERPWRTLVERLTNVTVSCVCWLTLTGVMRTLPGNREPISSDNYIQKDDTHWVNYKFILSRSRVTYLKTEMSCGTVITAFCLQSSNWNSVIFEAKRVVMARVRLSLLAHSVDLVFVMVAIIYQVRCFWHLVFLKVW